MINGAMQRQNSMPMTGIPVELSAPQFFPANMRRMSHDVCSIRVTRGRSGQHRMSHPTPIVSPFQPFNNSPITTNRTLSFGYASSTNQYERVPLSKTISLASSITVDDDQRPSTSTLSSAQISRLPHRLSTSTDVQTAEFYVRLPNRQMVLLLCECPSGSAADFYLQSLSTRQKERLRWFIENEVPDVGEYHVWVQDNTTNRITVISVKTLENHFRHQHQRRVKWRHVSLDKVSVYRYSLPVITTKFRLRLLHFMSRHYRCCILCVWCCVIFFISIGIILTVVFGSAPHNNGRFVNYTTTPRAGHPYAMGQALQHNISTINFINYAASSRMSFQGG